MNFRIEGCQRQLMADLRRPALRTACPEAASRDEVLNVSKVASNSSGGVPGIGQIQSHDRSGNRHANDWCQSPAAIGLWPLERDRSPELSLTVLQP
jgi:hypothetical protein